MRRNSPLILAADIGGTSARFALYMAGGTLALAGGPVALKTAEHPGFESLCTSALESLGGRTVSAAVLAVAGPVEQDRFCRAPNIAYSFDLSSLSDGLLPERSLLINDFTAQAYGCRHFGEAKSAPVLPGRMDEGLTQAVVGAGTGLGKAALVPDGRGGFLVCGSEGGHAAFPFDGPDEQDFQRFAKDVLGEPYVRWESVVSGSGLALTHRYLTGEELSPREAADKLTGDALTTHWFARFLGRAMRDYVLEVLARGGLYISGGVAAKNPHLVAHAAFGAEFRLSATHEGLLASIPVRLITDQDVGLWGAAAAASQFTTQPGPTP